MYNVKFYEIVYNLKLYSNLKFMDAILEGKRF